MILLILGIIFVAVGLVGIVLAVLWPIQPPEQPVDILERFENNAKAKWLHGRG